VHLSIDDFGTGHSSLLRLHQLPVNELKIDRSFVAQLGTGPQAEIIVKSIIELGKSLGHHVVAEGIERASELQILQDLGCHTGQGFHYSPAVPRDDFLRLLENEKTHPINQPLALERWPSASDS
jgi:EAL domain-containing protein (putative c-di-GMP-specific phosphodiesterase class I)